MTRHRAATTPAVRRRRRTAGLLVVAALALGGCSSLTEDSSPTVIDEAALPAELVEQETTTTTDPPGATVRAQLYVIYSDDFTDEQLDRCAVLVEQTDTIEAAATVRLERLIELDPTESSACGNFMTNAVPPELEVLDVAVTSEGTAVIDLANLADVESTRQRQAVAQIVFTLTEQFGLAPATDPGRITGVIFLVDGEQTPVPVDERTAEAGSVITRADFPTLAAAPTTTSTRPATPAVPTTPPPAGG